MAIEAVASQAQAALARLPLHEFTIPESARELETDPHVIVMRQLTFGEEQQALSISEKQKSNFAYDGAMRAVVSADGKPITWDDNGKETFFCGLSNKVRDLVIRGFTQIALPTKEEVDGFFASMKTKAPG